MAGTRPLSDNPEAIRQRKHRERLALAAAANANLPVHETSRVEGAGPDAFASLPFFDPDSEDPKPFIPAEPEPPPAAPPPPPQTSPEEAKLFAKAVVGYFKFGTGMMLAKNPEFVHFLGQLAQSDKDVEKALSPEGFAVLSAFIGGAAERVAIKYNLRIPYLDEGVVIGAIGLATFGMVGKPSKAGKIAMEQAEHQARAAAAKDANAPSSPSSAPEPPIATEGNTHVEEELEL